MKSNTPFDTMYPLGLYVPQEEYEEVKRVNPGYEGSFYLESEYGSVEYLNGRCLTNLQHKALVYILFSNVYNKYGEYGPSLYHETNWIDSKEECRTRNFTLPQITEDLKTFEYMETVEITKDWILDRLTELRDCSFSIIPKNSADKHKEIYTHVLNSFSVGNNNFKVVFSALFSQAWETVWFFY